MRGSKTTHAVKNTPTRSARRSPTRGACTTCTATCLNGARIGMTSLCRVAQIQLAPTTARPACFAAAAGGATLATVGRLTATAPSRRSTAPWVSVWPAVSRFSISKRRHGGRGGCRSLTLPQRRGITIRSHCLGESINQIMLCFFMRLICTSTARRYRVPRLACKLTSVTTPSRGIPCESLLLLRCCFV